jgi:hypothetical protein
VPDGAQRLLLPAQVLFPSTHSQAVTPTCHGQLGLMYLGPRGIESRRMNCPARNRGGEATNEAKQFMVGGWPAPRAAKRDPNPFV